MLPACIGLFFPGHVRATSISNAPRPARLLSGCRKFIAQDARNSLALYRASDGQVLQRYQARDSIGRFDVTTDERLLLTVTREGSIELWNIETGEQLWSKDAEHCQWAACSQYAVTFARDGCSFLALKDDLVRVFDTQSGRQVDSVRFTLHPAGYLSAALSPDGTLAAGVFDFSGGLFVFERATGESKESGLTGSGPICFSTDGRFLAFGTAHSSSALGVDQQLRIVALARPLAAMDVGRFSYIGHVKPLPGGSFQITARVGGRRDPDSRLVGMQYAPATKQLREIWRLPANGTVQPTADFDADRMLAVSTDWRLLTHLVNVRTGASLLTIDNSANYFAPRNEPAPSTWTGWLVLTAAPVILVGIVLCGIRFRAKLVAEARLLSPHADAACPEDEAGRQG